MDIGMNLHAYPCSTEEQLSLMKEHGFSATFCMADVPSLTEDIAACRAVGIQIESLHTPFRHINDMWRTGADGDAMLDELCRSVDACAAYDIPTAVVHLSSGTPPPAVCDVGLNRYCALLDHAKAKGVTCAFENIRTLGNLSLLLEERSDAAFCWDVGHELCFTGGREYMPLFGERIAALHVHDNMGVKNFDEHRLPFDGVIDYDKAAAHLARADYQKALMLEVFYHPKHNGDMTARAYVRSAADAARRIARMVDEKRT